MATCAAPPKNPAKTKCVIHKTKNLTNWCFDCERCICPSCMTSNDHSDHQKSKLSDLAPEKRNNIKKYIDRVNIYALSELQKEIQSIDDKSEEITQAFQTLEFETVAFLDVLKTLKSRNINLLEKRKSELKKIEELNGRKKRFSSKSGIVIHNTESDIKDTASFLDTPDFYMPRFYPRAAIYDYLSVALSELEIPGFRNCERSKCNICQYTETQHYFKSSFTEKTYRIRHSLSCTSTNVIYLITCARCKKQYVGETGRTLEVRIKEHVKKNKLVVDTHFKQKNGHESEDIKVIAIDHSKYWNRENRCIREEYWIGKLQTKNHGLNVKS